MKKLLAILLILAMSLTLLTACGDKPAISGEREPLTWELYVAAGMKKPMDVVVAAWQAKTGDTVNVNYSSSGALFAQIEQGQPCDLYFTADWIYVEKMQEAELAASYTPFLNDNVALVVSESAKEKIKSFEDLTKKDITLCVCDYAAPVGLYAEDGLRSMGLWNGAEPQIVARPSTVNQAAIMVLQDEVDAALIFSSVANANSLTPVALMDTKDSGEIIFATVTVKGENEAIANEFVKFANEYVGEFEKYGWKAYAK